MGFVKDGNSRRIRRTVDGGYLYCGVVYRPDGDRWQVDLPDGQKVPASSQESARRAINAFLAGQPA